MTHVMYAILLSFDAKTLVLFLVNTWMIHAVDRWRVVLKGENPDYINATNVHVSNLVYYIIYHSSNS